MNLFIPPIGTKMKLTAPWTFSFYEEYRNCDMRDSLREHGHKLKATIYNGWTDKARNLGDVTLPVGTQLIVKRIYIRLGQKDFDSITFQCKSPDGVKGRFWAKLEDANKIQMELTQE